MRSGLYTLKNSVEFLQDRFNMIEYSQYKARMHYKQALKMACQMHKCKYLTTEFYERYESSISEGCKPDQRAHRLLQQERHPPSR